MALTSSQTSNISASVSPAKATEPHDDMFRNYAGPMETQQPNETAEESFRVEYQDPTAERERQKLLAGYRVNGPSKEPQTTRNGTRESTSRL